jgi:predicted molibdopterin-dependent oxidoreductase YjgC
LVVGAGCKLKLVVDNNKIIRAEAADGVTNQNQLCLKTVNRGSLSRRARRATIAVSPGGDADAGPLRYAGRGAGCKLKLVVDNNKIIRAEAADGVTNQNQLCLNRGIAWW